MQGSMAGLIIAILSLAIVSGAGPSERFDAGLRPGDRVIVSHDAAIRDVHGSIVEIPNRPLAIFRLLKVQGQRAEVVAEPYQGWVVTDQVFGFERAGTIFTDEIASARDPVGARIGRAAYLMATNRQDDARVNLDEAIRLGPDLMLAREYRGILRADRRDFVGAVADFSEAIRLNPKVMRLYLERAEARMDLGDPSEALADYRVATLLEPRFVRAIIGRGLARAALGDRPGAIADYGEALRLDPWSEEALYDRGLARAALGNTTAAIDDFSEAIRLRPGDAAAYCDRGLARSALGERAEARVDYDRAIQFDPGLARAFHNRGILRTKDDPAGALADFSEAARLQPTESRSLTARATVWSGLGNYDQAEEDCNQAIRLNPRSIDALGNRGNVRLARGDFSRAVADYDAVLRIEPGHAATYRNRALAHQGVGNRRESVADYTEAIRHDPKAVDALDGLAWMQATDPDPAWRDASSAIVLATRACQLTSWNEGRYLGTLAAALAESGDFAGAEAMQRKTLPLLRSFEDVQIGRDRLERYRSNQPVRESIPLRAPSSGAGEMGRIRSK